MLGFVCGVYLLVVSRHASDLRANARASSQCDPRVQHNCYAEAAGLMLEEAGEQESARDAAYLLLAVAATLSASTLVLRRRRGDRWA